MQGGGGVAGGGGGREGGVEGRAHNEGLAHTDRRARVGGARAAGRPVEISRLEVAISRLGVAISRLEMRQQVISREEMREGARDQRPCELG